MGFLAPVRQYVAAAAGALQRDLVWLGWHAARIPAETPEEEQEGARSPN